MNPALFTNILLAARNLCGQDLTTGIVKHPAKGLKLGTRFQALIDAVESAALEKQLPSVNVVQKSCSDIRRLFHLRWDLGFTGNVRRSMQEKVKNKIQLVPLASDVKKLSQALNDNNIERLQQQLSKEFDIQKYVYLHKSVQALTIMFNRRRAGEVSPMLMSDWDGQHSGASTLSLNDMDMSPV